MLNINPEATFFNPDLSLADLGISKDKLHLIFTTEYGWPGRLVEPLILTKEIGPGTQQQIADGVEARDFKLVNQHRPNHLQINPATGKRYSDSFDLLEIYKYINESATVNLDSTAASRESASGEEIHMDVFESIREFLQNAQGVDFLSSVGATVILEQITKAVAGMKSVAAVVESEFVTSTMLRIARRVVVHELAPVVLMGSLRILSLTLNLMSSTLKAGSVVLNVIGFLDLFLQFADFIHQQRVKDQGFVDSYSILDLETNFRCFGYRTVEMSPVHVIAMMENLNMPDLFELDTKNTPTNNTVTNMHNSQWAKLRCMQSGEECIHHPYEIGLEDMVDRNDFKSKMLWTAEYIYALKFNSNGLQIDWVQDSNLIPTDDASLNHVHKIVDIETFAQYQDFIIYY